MDLLFMREDLEVDKVVLLLLLNDCTAFKRLPEAERWRIGEIVASRAVRLIKLESYQPTSQDVLVLKSKTQTAFFSGTIWAW